MPTDHPTCLIRPDPPMMGRMKYDAYRMHERGNPEHQLAWNGITIRQLMREADANEVAYPTEPGKLRSCWIWEAGLLRGEFALLLGNWKIGKSTLLTELFRCVSKGQPMLGQRTTATHIAIITEEPLSLWARRSTDCPLPDSLFLWPMHDMLRLPISERVDWIINRISVDTIGLIVIDSLGPFLPPGAEGNSTVMADFLASLRQANGMPAILLVHHPAKVRSNDMAFRGTNLLPASAHSIFELQPYSRDPADAHRRVLKITTRLPPSPRWLAYEWQPDNHRLQAIAMPVHGDWCGDRDLLKVILAILADRPDGTGTVRDLHGDWPDDAPPCSRSTLLRQLNTATQQNILTRTGRGVKTNPHIYRLAEKTP
jgi:hypothetical protein